MRSALFGLLCLVVACDANQYLRGSTAMQQGWDPAALQQQQNPGLLQQQLHSLQLQQATVEGQVRAQQRAYQQREQQIAELQRLQQQSMQRMQHLTQQQQFGGGLPAAVVQQQQSGAVNPGYLDEAQRAQLLLQLAQSQQLPRGWWEEHATTVFAGLTLSGFLLYCGVCRRS
eukprot:Hpha_TRINITY_DN3173_c0_g1::TRINITY_DN3173_c0_g1_i1::g.96782::m.96782